MNSSINPIQKIGHLMRTDPEGYLINECNWDSIQLPWLNLVEALRSICIETLGDRLHSINLRCSVPRGQAILNVSDLDSIVIIQGETSHELIAKITDIEIQLEKPYPFCQKVEIIPISYSEMQQPKSHWQTVLQTQGLCIYGEDLRSQFPQFKPNLDLVSHAFHLEEDLAETQIMLRQIPANSTHLESIVKQKCRWINKRIVRTGFELVMQKENAFTRDLYPCYERFAHHFPHHARLMYKALELAIQPSSNRDGLLMFLSHFGKCLVKEVNQNLR